MTIKAGYGYSSLTKDDKEYPIFNSELISNPTKKNLCKVRYFVSMSDSSSDYNKNLSNSTDLSVPTGGLANLRGSLKMSKVQQKESEDVTYFINLFVVERSEELVFTHVPKAGELQAGVSEMLHDTPYDFYTRYGDSYISSIFYGKEVTLSIKFSKVSSQVKKELEGLLEVGLQDGIGIKQTTSLDSFAKKNQLKYEIQVSAVGFKLDLPKLMTNRFSDLVDWMQKFETEFNKSTANTEQEQANILYYETASYNNIFGSAVTPLLQKARGLERILFIIGKCKAAIAYYDKYYDSVPDAKKDDNLASIYEELKDVEESFYLNQSSNITADTLEKLFADLNKVIGSLNGLRLNPIDTDTKLSFRYAGIRQEYASPLVLRTMRFGLVYPKLQFEFSHFSIDVKSTTESLKLKGLLTLKYCYGYELMHNLTARLITTLVQGENNVPIRAMELPQINRPFAVFYTPHEDEINSSGKRDINKVETLKNSISITVRYNYNRVELIQGIKAENIPNMAKRLSSKPPTVLFSSTLLNTDRSYETQFEQALVESLQENEKSHVPFDNDIKKAEFLVKFKDELVKQIRTMKLVA